jgi:hypothetical protein
MFGQLKLFDKQQFAAARENETKKGSDEKTTREKFNF